MVSMKVNDDSIVIPQNSLVEANQSGIIGEPFVDVTPQLPYPDYEVRLAQPHVDLHTQTAHL